MTPLDSCIAALRSGPTWVLFKAVDKAMAETVGHKLFTLLYVAPNGKLLGTMNLLDAAGHYKETDPAKCEPFAALLVGPFLDAIAADLG